MKIMTPRRISGEKSICSSLPGAYRQLPPGGRIPLHVDNVDPGAVIARSKAPTRAQAEDSSGAGDATPGVLRSID